MHVTRSDFMAGLSLGVSVLAAAFTGLQWQDAREQNKLSLMPTVDFYNQTDKVDLPIGLALTNHGPGTATIKSIIYYVDHVPVKDASEAEERGKINGDFVDEITLAENDSLSAGETVWLLSRSTKSKKELVEFTEFIDKHLAALVTYCSLHGECWQKCSEPGFCSALPESSPRG